MRSDNFHAKMVTISFNKCSNNYLNLLLRTYKRQNGREIDAKLLEYREKQISGVSTSRGVSEIGRVRTLLYLITQRLWLVDTRTTSNILSLYRSPSPLLLLFSYTFFHVITSLRSLDISYLLLCSPPFFPNFTQSL